MLSSWSATLLQLGTVSQACYVLVVSSNYIRSSSDVPKGWCGCRRTQPRHTGAASVSVCGRSALVHAYASTRTRMRPAT